MEKREIFSLNEPIDGFLIGNWLKFTLIGQYESICD